jgi:hypothetical protein
MRRRRNPARYQVKNPTDAEFLIGGLASVSLVCLGVYLAFKSQGTTLDTSTTLGDTSALTALAFVV